MIYRGLKLTPEEEQKKRRCNRLKAFCYAVLAGALIAAAVVLAGQLKLW